MHMADGLPRFHYIWGYPPFSFSALDFKNVKNTRQNFLLPQTKHFINLSLPPDTFNQVEDLSLEGGIKSLEQGINVL